MTAVLLALRAHWGKLLVAVVIALLVLTIGTQGRRVAGLQTEIAEAQAEAALERLSREQAARDHETELGRRERAHAAAQQEKEDAYTQDRAAWAAARAADAAAARSLRDRLAAATTRDRSGGPVAPSACERDADRLESLGRLAGEGVELVAEARSLLDQRDLEVRRLLSQIELDRAACAPKQVMSYTEVLTAP